MQYTAILAIRSKGKKGLSKAKVIQLQCVIQHITAGVLKFSDFGCEIYPSKFILINFYFDTTLKLKAIDFIVMFLTR